MKQNNAKRKNYKQNNYGKSARSNATRRNYQDAFADSEKAKGCKGSKFPQKLVSKDEVNDPTWYFKQATLLNDVASFSFSHPLGEVLVANNADPTHESRNGALSSIPGLMSLTLIPTPGISTDAQSPLNLAAQNAYSFVRRTNSGAVNYNAPDLMLYFLASDSLYMAWNWMKRIYGYASTYSAQNKYLPVAYAAADCVDLEDIYSNLADFRAFLNMAANRISAFAVPATFNLMVRHSWVFSNIFKDSDTTKAQQYILIPALFYQYDETTSPNGGVLAPVNVTYTRPSSPYTFKQLRDMLNDMINAMQYSEDIGTMSGDMIKAYGESGLFKLSQIDPDYRVDAIYSKEVLTEFENCEYWKFPQFMNTANFPQFTVKQDPNTNFIKYQPILATPNVYCGDQSDRYINFHWASPTPADVMVATRFNCAYTSSPAPASASSTTTLTDCGSELAMRCTIYWFGQGTDVFKPYDPKVKVSLQSYDMGSVSVSTTGASTPTTMNDLVLRLSLPVTFDWAPAVYLFPIGDNGGVPIPAIRDWDVYTKLDVEDFRALNELALLSMFNVPN